MFHRFIIALTAAVSLIPSAVWAVDKDDDLIPDDGEKIAYESGRVSAKSLEIEQTQPEAAESVRLFLQNHVEHAQNHDIEAYLNDFAQQRIRHPELAREYAERAMALKDLKLTVHAVEFAQLSATAATVHTRQVSAYTDNAGAKVTDDAIISYRLIKVDTAWKIAFTERRRLTAP